MEHNNRQLNTMQLMSYLKLADKQVHVDSDIVCPTQTLGGPLTKIYPTQGSKIRWLSTIQSSIETSMVTIGKGNDKLTFFLYNLLNDGTAMGSKTATGTSILLPCWMEWSIVGALMERS